MTIIRLPLGGIVLLGCAGDQSLIAGIGVVGLSLSSIERRKSSTSAPIFSVGDGDLCCAELALGNLESYCSSRAWSIQFFRIIDLGIDSA